MHQTSTTQSPTHINQSHSRSVVEKNYLHPALQAALSSLDVQLEEELTRYRRRRAGHASYSPRPIAHRQVKAIDLKPVASSTEPTSPAAIEEVEFRPTATVSPLATIASEALPESSHQSSELKQLAQQYATQVADASDLDASLNATPDDYLESSEELLRTLSQEEAQVKAEQGFMQSLLTPLGLGSMLLLLMSSALFGFVVMNPSGISQLLAERHHPTAGVAGDGATGTDAGSAPSPQPNLATQEFPELNLGNLGSVPIEPGAPGPTIQPTAPKAAGPTQTANLGASGMTGGNATISVSAAPTQAERNESPPIAGVVRSPRNLAPATAETTPAAKPYLPPVSNYRPPTRSYRPPPVRTYNPPPAKVYTPPPARPIPVLPAPSPLPANDLTPPPPVAASSAPAMSPSNYKVVTPYTSDRLLENYRSKVPDAYVRNFSGGAKIQFGAYQDEAAAKSQVEELRKHGIPAEVYKP